MANKNKEVDLIIRFPNQKTLEHFAQWLCGAGEQDYWNWMEYREQEETGDITATVFHYHGEEDESKDLDDEERYGEFLEDNIIRTTVSRLDK
jgi:hypothetical protein